MSASEKRKENIAKLEKLAQEVLQLKNIHRQRRPIVIEFCGSPKAGKTSSINSLNIFLKRTGFKTAILTERASVCPISDKESPVFNSWTCSATINEINEKIDLANTSPNPENNLDIIICDRGIFDALCWFRWLKNRNKMDDTEYDVLTQFALLNRWQKNIDLVYVFVTTPEESIRREYANLLTDKRGSIMKEDILSQYKDAVQQTLSEYKNAFRATYVIDTTEQEQNSVGYEVTEKTLMTLRDMLMEKIGYVHSSNLILHDGINEFSSVKTGLEKIQYDLRDRVESDSNLIQPIAIAVVTTHDQKKVFCVKKTAKSTEKSSPESGQTLLYVGGHMRREDCSSTCDSFLDVLRNTLKRELYEELGISIAIDKSQIPFVIYTPDNVKSKKHLAIGWKISMDEETKFRLDSYELVQKKGKTRSGSFVPLTDIVNADMSFESWSKTILLNLFSEQLTKPQREYIEGHQIQQLEIFDIE